MAKYFLGSVGKAEAFRKTAEDKYELAFVSKTLTDSGLNISTTKDDIRGGQGAPIQFSFYHDPNVEITLTDIVWDRNYLTAQLGAEFLNDESKDYVTGKAIFKNGRAPRGNNPTVYEAPVPCNVEDAYLVWGSPIGKDEWINMSYDALADEFQVKNDNGELIDINGEYCVRYLGRDDRAYQAIINSLIIPEELFLVITAPLFAGDACSASNGKAAGHITFEVPRFQLNGAQEFAMNMSQNQTMSLAGIALATSAADCDDEEGGKLLRIIEVLNNRDRTWKDDVLSLLVEDESEKEGSHPSVYAEMKDGHLRKLEAADLKYAHGLIESGLTNYSDMEANTVFESGYYKFELKGAAGIESETVVIGNPVQISFAIQNGSCTASDEAAFVGGVVTGKIVAKKGYVLPAATSDINVAVTPTNAASITEYNANTGVFQLTLAAAPTADDINVSATCPKAS